MPAPTRSETILHEVEEEADKLVENYKEVDTVDTNARYAAYTMRIRTAFRSAGR
jgi:fission process protein 1